MVVGGGRFSGDSGLLAVYVHLGSSVLVLKGLGGTCTVYGASSLVRFSMVCSRLLGKFGMPSAVPPRAVVILPNPNWGGRRGELGRYTGCDRCSTSPCFSVVGLYDRVRKFTSTSWWGAQFSPARECPAVVCVRVVGRDR